MRALLASYDIAVCENIAPPRLFPVFFAAFFFILSISISISLSLARARAARYPDLAQMN